jgi:hypothetical protein
LTAHEWQPAPILISFGTFAGDGGVSGPPELTLLGDGNLYVNEGGELYKGELQEEEVCKLLNTIDQSGFFAYDPRVINYDFMGDGGGGGYMNVDAWQSQHFYLMDLEAYVNGEVDDEGRYSPPILNPIVDTFRLLESYRPSQLQPANGRIEILNIREPWFDISEFEVLPWPEDLFSISSYYQNSLCEDVAFRELSDNEFRRILDLGLIPFHSYVSDQGNVFQLGWSTLMPWEHLPACANQFFPEAEIIVEDLPESLSCTPEDGVIQIQNP